MKNLIVLIGVLVISCTGLFAQKVNEKVQADYNGSWYDATILKVNEAEQKYYITYDGWDDSWDEWVGIERIKGFEEKAPLGKFKIGDRVEAEYGMIPEPATVVEVGENKYHIKFDNKMFGDKWVVESQIKKL